MKKKQTLFAGIDDNKLDKVYSLNENEDFSLTKIVDDKFTSKDEKFKGNNKKEKEVSYNPSGGTFDYVRKSKNFLQTNIFPIQKQIVVLGSIKRINFQ